MMKIIKLISISLCIIIFLTACGKASANENVNESTKVVRLYETVSETISEKQEYIGVVHPETSYTYASKIPGKIRHIHVSEGDLIEESTLLFEIDAKDINSSKDNTELKTRQSEQQLEQAELAVVYKKEQLGRGEILVESGALSRVAYDGLKLKYDQAVLDVANAQKQLERMRLALAKEKLDANETSVYANKNGYVTKVLTEVEGFVATGQPIIVMQSATKKIVVGVTEEAIGAMRIGDILYLSHDEQSISTTIMQIASMPDHNTRLYAVEVLLPDALNDQYPIGAIVRVYQYGETLRGVLLPVSVVQKDQGLFVYTIEENRVVGKEVEVLKDLQNELLIEGLDIGDQVVIEGMSTLDVDDYVTVLSGAVN